MEEDFGTEGTVCLYDNLAFSFILIPTDINVLQNCNCI